MKKNKQKASREKISSGGQGKMGKRKFFLIIYCLIIIILLIFILFIAPDSMFSEGTSSDIDDYLTTDSEEIDNYVDFLTMQEHLENNKYEYKYNISDTESVNYKCIGVVSGTEEEGTCTAPEDKSYTEKNKAKILANINVNYLTPSYLFDLISLQEGDLVDYGGTRCYTYDITSSKNLEIEIMIYTDYEEINRITVSTAYEVYDITFSNIEY